MKYATDKFFEIMYSMRGIRPLSHAASREAFKADCAERKDKLKEALGIDKIEAVKFEQNVKRISEHHYEIEILPGLTMPVWTLTPERSNGKTVLYLPGHNSHGAQGSFNYYGQNETFHKWLPLQMQHEGFTVVIPELMGFGKMIKKNYTEEFSGCYANTEILQLFGISIAGLRTYQAMCTLKIMKENLGHPMSFIYGISGGGLIAMLLSALTGEAEATVLSNYGASFRSSLMETHHCVDNFIPGLLNIGECADILAMIAPAPLMLTNGTDDHIFPKIGVNDTATELKKIYSLLGAEDNFVNSFHSGGHETDSDTVIRFFKQYIPAEEVSE